MTEKDYIELQYLLSKFAATQSERGLVLCAFITRLVRFWAREAFYKMRTPAPDVPGAGKSSTTKPSGN